MKKALGTQVIVELYGCDPKTLTNRDYVEKALQEAAKKSNAHSIGSFFHQFQPHGVSGVIIIEESHYTIHTWPEHGYAAVDLFYCSEDVDVDKALEVLEEYFKPEKMTLFELKRGVLTEKDHYVVETGEVKADSRAAVV